MYDDCRVGKGRWKKRRADRKHKTDIILMNG